MESDYRNMPIDYMNPDKLLEGKFQVVLPNQIYENILKLMKLSIEGLKKEIISPLATGSEML